MRWYCVQVQGNETGEKVQAIIMNKAHFQTKRNMVSGICYDDTSLNFLEICLLCSIVAFVECKLYGMLPKWWHGTKYLHWCARSFVYFRDRVTTQKIVKRCHLAKGDTNDSNNLLQLSVFILLFYFTMLYYFRITVRFVNVIFLRREFLLLTKKHLIWCFFPDLVESL